MWIYTVLESISVTVAAIIATLTLILTIIKEIKHSHSTPTRRHLEYINKFGDYIANVGVGVMKITNIEIYYKGKLTEHTSLVDLYANELGQSGLIWSTYISNEEIINKNIAPSEEIRLVEIDPDTNSTNIPAQINLLNRLCQIRKEIKLKITYKEIYGGKKTKTI